MYQLCLIVLTDLAGAPDRHAAVRGAPAAAEVVVAALSLLLRHPHPAGGQQVPRARLPKVGRLLQAPRPRPRTKAGLVPARPRPRSAQTQTTTATASTTVGPARPTGQALDLRRSVRV